MTAQTPGILLRGIHGLSLDDKGRFALPAKMRPLLADHCGGQLVVTVDVEEPCLLIYPRPEWELVQAKLMALPSLNPMARRLQRMLMGQASDHSLDNAGRILIPSALREHAGLQHRMMLMGLGNKFELWSESVWQQRQDAYRQEMGQFDMINELKDLSL